MKLAKGATALVVSGDRAGQVGTIVSVKKGTSSREKMVALSLPSGETELPERLIFAVGTDKPVLEVQVKSLMAEAETRRAAGRGRAPACARSRSGR